MSLIPVLLSAEAATKHKAVRRTAYLHRTVKRRPLVVVAYNLSGEAAAPLAFCYGTSPKRPKVVVSAEPRNRESRFGAINEFSRDLVDFIAPFLELGELTLRRGRTIDVALEAPQLVVPNLATRNYLGERLGRSLRYLGLGMTHPVPEETQWAAAHLSWLAEHARMPGQSVFLAATELLNRHFATGQSSMEDENLASVLAWIKNAEDAGLAEIEAAEQSAYGPVPDPEFEKKLEPVVQRWTELLRAEDEKGRLRVEKKIHRLLSDELRPAYEATHQALEVARSIPAAPSVEERWEQDLRQWTRHTRRAARSIPRFSKRHTAIRAARMLEIWSAALDRLAYKEALDDPMVMAELDASGRCLSGTVAAVDLDNKEVKPGNRRATKVPLLTIKLDHPTRLLPREAVCWVEDDRVRAEVREVSDSQALLAVIGGHKGGTRGPKRRQASMFAALSVFGAPPPDSPEETPWTHRYDKEEEGASEEAPVDGSPDLSVEELAALPAGGGTPPEETPGVIQ